MLLAPALPGSPAPPPPSNDFRNGERVKPVERAHSANIPAATSPIENIDYSTLRALFTHVCIHALNFIS